jgi:hypothetical protein
MNPKHVNKDTFKQKTKRFFQSQRWKNLLVFFVFVGLAFCFWLLQYYQQKFEITLTIPIRYENVPEDIVFNHPLPQQLDVKISDKGTTLFHYIFKENPQTIYYDLGDISHEQDSYVVDRMNLIHEIDIHLLSSTQLISFSPETITIDYSPLEKKKLPVFFDGNISVEQGFTFVDSLEIIPSTVWVYGSKNALDTLQQICTQSFTSKPVNKNLNISLNLLVPDGVKLSNEKVDIEANIEVSTEKTFILPVNCYNLPKNLSIIFFPSSVKIVCSVALSKYSQLTEADLDVYIDYRELANNQSNIHLQLTKKPQWLTNYRMIPDNIEYLIEQKINL